MHQPIDAEDVERFERMNRNVEPQVIPALLTENQLTKSDNSLVKQSCLDGSLPPSNCCSSAEPTRVLAKRDKVNGGEPSEYDYDKDIDALQEWYLEKGLDNNMKSAIASEYVVACEEDCLVRRDVR